MRMTFAHPWILLGLILIPLLVVWYLWRYRHQEPAMAFSDTRILQSYKKSFRQRIYPLLYVLRLVAVAALVIALARPQTQLSRKEMKVEGIDIVLAMDLSTSMLAEDLNPNRIEAAKKVAHNFINGRKNDRMGMVVFAGEAFTQVPLTIDHQVLLKQLNSLKCGNLKDGTAIGDGLATAINRIKDSKAKSKVIILLTDGMNNQGSVDPQSAAEIAALYGIRLYTIGVGTRGYAPYPMRTPLGIIYQNVKADIDEPLLTSMANSTNDGQYFRATNKKSLENIFDKIDQMEKTKVDVTRYSHSKDEYMPFLLVALFAFGLEMLLKLFFFKN